MAFVILGLGNPGAEYAKTRHNAGRMVAELFAKEEGFDAFALRKGAHALITEGAVAKEKVLIALPETFMNKSGKSAMALVKSKKGAENLIVVRDDLDLPIGTVKMTFGRGSGGHKGVESVMRAIKTKEFAQLKVGISSATPKGKVKKVSGDEKVNTYVVGKFSPKDEVSLKKALKKGAMVVRYFITDGVEKATMVANTR